MEVDPATGGVVALDVDDAARELDPYREVATRWWKETEAPLADLREITSLPGDAVRGVKGLAGTWRRAVADMRADVAGGGYAPAHGDEEREQLRRSSATVRHRLQANPKQLAKVRASALAAGPIDPTDADLFEPAPESELSRAIDPLIEQAMQQSDEMTERKRDPEY